MTAQVLPLQRAEARLLSLSDIMPKRSQRVVIAGGTRCGKSCLSDWIMRYLVRMVPGIEILLLDTKPRFRALYTPRGFSAAGFYKHWQQGPTVPGSVRVDLDRGDPMRRVFKEDRRIAIMQPDTSGGSTPAEREQILSAAYAWWRHRTNKNPRFVIADEGMHFYRKNGYCINPQTDLFHEIAQTGGELDTGMIFDTQLLRGIDSMILDHISMLYAYYMRDERDVKRLHEIGIPKTYEQPKDDYAFNLIKVRPGGRLEELPNLKLTLPESYLRQLPPT